MNSLTAWASTFGIWFFKNCLLPFLANRLTKWAHDKSDEYKRKGDLEKNKKKDQEVINTPGVTSEQVAESTENLLNNSKP